MGLKRIIKSGKSKAHGAISDWLKPKVSSFGRKHRIAARIRLANRWATKHPKRTSAYVISTLVVMFVLNIIVTDASLESHKPELSEIAMVEPIFDGFRSIQGNKDAHRSMIMDLVNRGATLRQEIDSIMSMSSKSRADSIEIVARYKQLEQIANTLKIKYDD